MVRIVCDDDDEFQLRPALIPRRFVELSFEFPLAPPCSSPSQSTISPTRNPTSVDQNADAGHAFYRNPGDFLERSVDERVDLFEPASKAGVVAGAIATNSGRDASSCITVRADVNRCVPGTEDHAVTRKSAPGDLDEQLGKLAGYDQAFRCRCTPLRVRHERHEGTGHPTGGQSDRRDDGYAAGRTLRAHAPGRRRPATDVRVVVEPRQIGNPTDRGK